MALQICVREKGDVAILDLAGDLTAGDCPALPQQVKQLLSHGKRKIAVNLSQVGYADSTGLGSLVASFTSVRNQGGALRLLNPSPVIYAAIQVTLLDRVIQIYSSGGGRPPQLRLSPFGIRTYLVAKPFFPVPCRLNLPG